MVPGWVPFKIVSDSPALHSRWPLLLKIEISSNGQNCSILSQNVPKFELCKHNDELFSTYYRIFLWTLNFCRFWPIMQIRKKGGWNLKKIFSTETTEPISTKFCWNDSWMAPLPKLCPLIPTSNQDGRQAKNRKKGGWNFNCPLLL